MMVRVAPSLALLVLFGLAADASAQSGPKPSPRPAPPAPASTLDDGDGASAVAVRDRLIALIGRIKAYSGDAGKLLHVEPVVEMTADECSERDLRKLKEIAAAAETFERSSPKAEITDLATVATTTMADLTRKRDRVVTPNARTIYDRKIEAWQENMLLIERMMREVGQLSAGLVNKAATIRDIVLACGEDAAVPTPAAAGRASDAPAPPETRPLRVLNNCARPVRILVRFETAGKWIARWWTVGPGRYQQLVTESAPLIPPGSEFYVYAETEDRRTIWGGSAGNAKDTSLKIGDRTLRLARHVRSARDPDLSFTCRS